MTDRKLIRQAWPCTLLCLSPRLACKPAWLPASVHMLTQGSAHVISLTHEVPTPWGVLCGDGVLRLGGCQDTKVPPCLQRLSRRKTLLCWFSPVLTLSTLYRHFSFHIHQAAFPSQVSSLTVDCVCTREWVLWQTKVCPSPVVFCSSCCC